MIKISRTLPRVRELKPKMSVWLIDAEKRRTLPRVRELKQNQLISSQVEKKSHPSQGA